MSQSRDNSHEYPPRHAQGNRNQRGGAQDDAGDGNAQDLDLRENDRHQPPVARDPYEQPHTRGNVNGNDGSEYEHEAQSARAPLSPPIEDGDTGGDQDSGQHPPPHIKPFSKPRTYAASSISIPPVDQSDSDQQVLHASPADAAPHGDDKQPSHASQEQSPKVQFSPPTNQAPRRSPLRESAPKYDPGHQDDNEGSKPSRGNEALSEKILEEKDGNR